MVTGADGLVQYFKAFFKQYPLLKVEAGGLKQPVAAGAVQQIADSTAVWSTSAELHLYEHPQDVTCKVARVSFVFTLGRPTVRRIALLPPPSKAIRRPEKFVESSIADLEQQDHDAELAKVGFV